MRRDGRSGPIREAFRDIDGEGGNGPGPSAEANGVPRANSQAESPFSSSRNTARGQLHVGSQKEDILGGLTLKQTHYPFERWPEGGGLPIQQESQGSPIGQKFKVWPHFEWESVSLRLSCHFPFPGCHDGRKYLHGGEACTKYMYIYIIFTHT